MVDLNALVAFDRRTPDANGDPLGPFEEVFRCRASVDYQRGSETALAHRLEARQPATIILRDNATTKEITPAWQARIIAGRRVRVGDVFNITAAAPAKEYGFINLMAVTGVATG